MTRRALLKGVSALALGIAATASLSVGGFGLLSEAHAQAPATADLMKPGPLGDKSLGKADAPVTIIEYASMTCSHCADFNNNTFPLLKSRYIDTGKVRYILREFPLDPLAAGGFMLARCAPDDKFFPMVETLFKQQTTWAFVQNPIPPLLTIAKTFGFTQESFEKCLSDQKLLDAVEEVRTRGAQKFGVNSTPTFFINGKQVKGAISIDDLEKELQPLLKAS
jgi:protein-disulfide isomerase